MTAINQITTPAGTTGLVCEPWSKGEIYGVAANWAQASAPVYTYGRNGWSESGRQVADFRHSDTAALEAEITDAIAVSEGIPSDEVDSDEVDAIVSDAVEVSSHPAKLSELNWITAPRDGGQIVQRDYAGVADGVGGGFILMRIFDRSDNTTEYRVTDWIGDDFDPANGEVPDTGEFSELEPDHPVFQLI